jgi:4-amino-4-deoxy-L-arabinose transferase-like glycosyltransferase
MKSVGVKFLRLRTSLVFIFLLSLGLGTAYSALNPDSILPRRDALIYDTIGWNLAQGKGFSVTDGTPTALRGPIYPGFLAGVYLFAGHNYQAVRIAQVFIHAVNALLIFAVGMNTFDPKTAVLGAFLYTIYPAFTFYTGLILTEIVFTALLLVSVLFLTYAVRYESLVWAGISGLFLGLATLCKPTTLLYPVWLMLIFFVIRKERAKLIRLSVVLALAMGLVVLPWTLRNLVLFDRVMPVSVYSGYNLLLGSLPPDTSFDRVSFAEDYLTNPVEKDREALSQGISNIVANPQGYISQVPRKAVYFLLPEGMSVLGSSKTAQGLVLILFQLVILVLALAGWIINRFSLSSLILASLIIYFIGMHVVFISTPRFNLPIMPYVLLFSAAGTAPIVRYLSSRWLGPGIQPIDREAK